MEIISMIVGGTIQELMLRRRTFVPTVLLIIAIGLALFVLKNDQHSSIFNVLAGTMAGFAALGAFYCIFARRNAIEIARASTDYADAMALGRAFGARFARTMRDLAK